MRRGLFKYHFDKIPLYKGELHVLVGHDLAALCRAADLPEYGVNGIDLCHFQAFVFTGEKQDRSGYFLLLRPDSGAGTVCHEVTHLKNRIFKDRGVHLDANNDEPEAYLAGWLGDAINYALTSPNVKPTKKISLL